MENNSQFSGVDPVKTAIAKKQSKDFKEQNPKVTPPDIEVSKPKVETSSAGEKPEEKPEIILKPLNTDDIMRLMGQPLPNKEALKELKDNKAPDAERLKELEKVQETKTIDYTKTEFVNEDLFNRMLEDPKAMNSYFQQFAQFIAQDTAEKIAFLERNNKNYVNEQSSKLMSDLNTSQLIQTYLSKPENSHLLPYQDYFIFSLGEKRRIDNGGHDLHQLIRLTEQEMRAKFNIKKSNDEQKSEENSEPVFGGLGGSFGQTIKKGGVEGWGDFIKGKL